MDGHLFLIQHLLILQEQITPFDINFCITNKELDFSLMKDAFSSLLRGNFSWRRNSFGSPRVVENRIDTRKDLENAIHDSIQEFCVHATSDFLGTLSSFVTRVCFILFFSFLFCFLISLFMIRLLHIVEFILILLLENNLLLLLVFLFFSFLFF